MCRPEIHASPLDFWRDDRGDMPVLRWIRQDLNAEKRRLMGTVMREVLQELGPGVCESEWGRQLGSGLFEFRCRGDRGILLRAYYHAHGELGIHRSASTRRGRLSPAGYPSRDSSGGATPCHGAVTVE